MKNKKDLYELIRSLTKSELRYVTISLQSKRIAKTDNVILMNEIRKQKSYDEKAIKQKFCNSKFIDQFEVKKHYLYKAIVKQLRTFYYDKFNLPGSWEHVEILINKGLYQQANRTVDEAIAKAKKEEEFSLITRLLDQKAKLSQFLPDHINRLAIIKELQKNQEIYLNNFAFNTLYIKTRTFADNFTFCRTLEHQKNAENIQSDPLLDNDKNSMSIKSLKLFWTTKFLVSAVKSEWEDCYSHAKREYETLSELESNSFIIKDWQIGVHTHLIVSAIHTKRYDEAHDWLERFSRLSENVKHVQDKRIHEFWNQLYSLMLINKAGVVNTNSKKLANATNFLEQNRPFIEPARLNMLYFELAKSYFQLKDYRNASRMNMKVLIHSEKTEHSLDLHAFSSILDLIISYEQGNMNLVESRHRRSLANLKGRNILYPFEEAFLNFARYKLTAIIGSDKESIKQVFQVFYDSVKHHFTDPLGIAIHNYFDFEKWIMEKIEPNNK